MTLELDKPFDSYSDKKGEWDKRKISLFGVARSIISQLKFGQDLTSIGLPAVFLLPFSLLELAANRKLGHFKSLLPFNEVDTDVERMMLVVKWFLSYISEEQPNKKPYNPVIGETHTCMVDHGDSVTKFCAEQVSHHPPITAFRVKNKERKIIVDGNFSFGVNFETNSVVCTTDGFIEVKSMNEELEDEVYTIDKGLPDLLIGNVIFGTRTMGWTGDVNITCEKNGLRIPLVFKKHKSRVTISGGIYRYDEQLYEFTGRFIEEPIYAYPLFDDLESVLLFDRTSLEVNEIIYPFPFEVPDLNSFKVWGTVTESILINDMNSADVEKKKIEAEQRRRIKQWSNTNFMYFDYDEELNKWIYSKRKDTEPQNES